MIWKKSQALKELQKYNIYQYDGEDPATGEPSLRHPRVVFRPKGFGTVLLELSKPSSISVGDFKDLFKAVELLTAVPVAPKPRKKRAKK